MVAPLVLGLVTIERFAELLYARRNTHALLARGAVEAGSGHYGSIVLLHTAWLAGLWLVAWDRPVALGGLVMFGLLQGLRAWVLLTLGRRWTTRIIVMPGEPRVATGPYRFMAHPNYAVVFGEIAVLPLAFGLPAYAALFTLLNGVLLCIRIGAEDAALAQ